MAGMRCKQRWPMMGLTGAETTTLVADASGLSVDGRSLLAQDFGWIQVAPTPDLVTVLLSTGDYGSDETWGWVVQVSTEGTADLADDTISVTSATFGSEKLPEEHHADAGSVMMSSTMRITPDCRRNPVAGSILMEGHSDWPLLDIRSRPTCDGQLSIDSTTQADQWTPVLDLLAGQ